MKIAVNKIHPEEFILSVLTPEDRIDAAFMVAREAFKKRNITESDIDRAVESIRKHRHE